MRRPADPTYRGVVAVFETAFRALGLRFDIRGSEHIPADGPVVLASNHLSYLDFTFVGKAAAERHRLVRFMAKQAVFDAPVAGTLMRGMRHIPVDRANGAAAYRRAARYLAAGEPVGIFPEATISRSFELKSFKLGAATLCVWEQVPLVPVVLWAPQRIITVDHHRSLRRGKTISVRVGEPIRAPRDADRDDVDARLRVAMSALLDDARRDYPDRPRDAADDWWLPRSLGGGAPSEAEAAALDAAALRRRAAGTMSR